MATVKFRRLSIRDAEDVIAEMWNCLEEYDIRSPRMTFVFGRDGEVSFGCRFDEPLSAQLVALRLSAWFAAEDRPGEIAAKADEADIRYSLFSKERRAVSRGASHLATMASLHYPAVVRAR